MVTFYWHIHVYTYSMYMYSVLVIVLKVSSRNIWTIHYSTSKLWILSQRIQVSWTNDVLICGLWDMHVHCRYRKEASPVHTPPPPTLSKYFYQFINDYVYMYNTCIHVHVHVYPRPIVHCGVWSPLFTFRTYIHVHVHVHVYVFKTKIKNIHVHVHCISQNANLIHVYI